MSSEHRCLHSCRCWVEESVQRQGGKELHERYLLTDIGCIKVGPGLDEGEAGEEFELVRLGQDLYRDVWTDYASEHPSYECIKDIPIIRKAGPNR